MTLFRSQQFADHTAAALSGAYVRYLMDRTGRTAEEVRDFYYHATGNVPDGNPRAFCKWASRKVMLMDQHGQDPFEESAA